ncbi:MAG: group II intron reverse transcriptase/maturase [Myxococcaceae bacterium]
MELLEGKHVGTSSPDNVSTKQQRIAKLAKEEKRALTTLAHHIDIEWLEEAFRRTRKDGAPGTDGVTATEYEAKLRENLQRLLDGAKSGTYRAPAVRRVHIPKGDGKQLRPIGIPTFEDKVLQRAVHMVLEPVYEQEFHDCSYGFRSGRSAHQALRSLREQMMEMGGGWLLEVDIKSFFDTLDHRHLQELLRRRVRDGVLLRLIGKWLNAGVQHEGRHTRPEAGTPQGGVISPLLANIYLHEVLDEWVEKEVKPRLGGRCFLIRYADDFVMGFFLEADARRVLDVLPKRFGKYGLTLHPEKTRLVRFERPKANGSTEPESFDFLAFTHYWARSLKGLWVIKRKTAKSRFTRSLSRIREWCRRFRHAPIAVQHQHLSAAMRGHFGYFGISGNSAALARFAHEVKRVWHKWLARRSQRGMRWDVFKALIHRHPLPAPRVMKHAIA